MLILSCNKLFLIFDSIKLQRGPQYMHLLCVHTNVQCCESERDRGLFRHFSLRSSYWVQTARLLYWLGLGPPGSQRKVPFLAPLKLNCGYRPCNLETQLLIYQHRNYIRYSPSPCWPFERLQYGVGFVRPPYKAAEKIAST